MFVAFTVVGLYTFVAYIPEQLGLLRLPIYCNRLTVAKRTG